MSPVPGITPPPPVEARSLSSITAVAANPPAYPRNPTHDKHDPLELSAELNLATAAAYALRTEAIERVESPRRMAIGANCGMHAYAIDIFLSPVKPPTKSSVSAEAINASLYYLHVATPEDDALLEEVELEREKQQSQNSEASRDAAQRDLARLNNFRRKPVGTEHAPMSQENGRLPSVPRRPLPGSHASVERVPSLAPPAPSTATTTTTTTTTGPGTEKKSEQRDGHEDAVNTGISRLAVPSLSTVEIPFHQDVPTGDDQPRKTNRWSAFANNLQNVPSRSKEVWREKLEAASAGRYSLDASRPQLPPRWSHNNGPRSPNRSPEHSPNRQPRQAPAHRRDVGFRLTLIRRDPASGSQWNVATISTPRIDHNTVDIEISTPGYNRFAGSQEALSLADLAANLPPGMFQSPGSSLPAALKNAPSGAHQIPGKPQSSAPGKFRRQLCVSRQFEQHSGNWRGTAETGHGPNLEGSKLKSGYYAFNSPWNGICTFSSSVNGRSLKCKHMIPTPGNPSHADSDGNQTVTVAEIRFNMPFQAASLHYQASRSPQAHQQSHPSQDLVQTAANPHPISPRQHSSHIFSSESNTNTKRNTFTQLLNTSKLTRPRATSGPGLQYQASPQAENPRASSSHGHPIRRTSFRTAFSRQNEFRHHYPPPPNQHRSGSTSSGGGYDSDEDRLDFSLARELAGGGIRGKSAKLGKLVIEDEGIKMLDLVVAACMAVWWRGCSS
ncbi:hypothetical protein N7539_006318 [Penicillium diatomitis]|uniref:Uncharacterized protein n=1 Tax=Penicillium diatomitis TaxID=2819901 RepID=A0A9X0BST7_9EURO|nr:uncharacterized protein N7539_006318 [Penicillium diatomitis]KAJ5482872.1 hypothetical protein N7539_006318 [Penicillium diatomitis]